MKVCPPLDWTLHEDRAYILFLAIRASAQLSARQMVLGECLCFEEGRAPKDRGPQ